MPEGLRHQIEVLYRLYDGFPQFVALVIAGSVLSILLLSWLRYARARRQDAANVGPFPAFARQTLWSRGWGLCLLLVLDAFLISNHVLARGLAVGMWDCDGNY